MTGIDLDQHHFPVKCHRPYPVLFSSACPFTTRLFLVYNLGHMRLSLQDERDREGEGEREKIRGKDKEKEGLTRGTKGRARARELLAGYSTPLPTVFLDYYRRSCAHNLCFPSTVRKRAVRQRRAHNDAIV